MIPGVDPRRLADIKKTSKDLKGNIKVDYKTGSILVQLTGTTPESQKLVSPMLKTMIDGFSMQFKMMFGMEVTTSEGDIKAE